MEAEDYPYSAAGSNNNNNNNDLRSTDPRHDKKRIEQTKGGLLRDSYRWILTHHDFLRWRDDPESRLLWIKGDPGKGKTMLLCGIIDELMDYNDRTEQTANTTHLLSFFFCQATDDRLNNATGVLRGLIYLLADQQRPLVLHIQNKYDHAGKTLFEDVNAWVALRKIFINILRDPHLPDTTLVVDALDECGTDLSRLLDLIKETPSKSRIKWLLSSRNRIDIEQKLRPDNSRTRLSLELKSNADHVSHAVNAYIDHCIWEIPAIQNNKQLQAQVRDQIRRKADVLKPTVEDEWNAYLSTLVDHDNPISSVAFLPDYSRVVSEDLDRTIKVWDVATGACLLTLEGHGRLISSVAFSPDSSRVATDSWDGTAKVWDAATGACLLTLEGHGRLISSVAFSPDSNRMASNFWDGTVKVWDAATGACLSTFEGHSSFTTSVAFSPDSGRVVSGFWDGTVKVWDVATGACPLTLKGHGRLISFVAFSPDSRRVVSGSWDGIVKVWDVATGACLLTLEDNSRYASSVGFSPDGGSLIIDTRTISLPASPENGLLPTSPQQSPNDYYNLRAKEEWITYNGRNLLWLPADYRPECSATTARTIAVGCGSGRVWMATFSFN
ncbi:hypothetical protein DL771_010266 [Monosporascus sp. 5C6A]|nr:hypothetical protein DL771_010266 [Monosporascus sp. 5C6A]